jgi:hypothetical protein
VVDGVRMPVYLWSEGTALLEIGPLIAIMSGGVIAGTLLGRPILGRLHVSDFQWGQTWAPRTGNLAKVGKRTRTLAGGSLAP